MQIPLEPPQEKLPISRVIITVLLSTLLISGSASLGLLYYQHIHEMRIRDPAYQIQSVVQTGPIKEQLSTAYLVSRIGLDLKKPVNLYQFDAQSARQKLLEDSLIKEASIKKVSPGTLYIDYTVRTPVAAIADFTHTLIDEDGVLFPDTFYDKERVIPQIVLGLHSVEWGKKVKNREYALAQKILNELQLFGIQEVTMIDVSKAFSPSYGQREIVVESDSHLLRLSPEEYHQDLANYTQLRDHLLNSDRLVIDLRIPHLAFLD